MSESVQARIVYWGIDEAGKSSNLRVVQAKLKAENRGELVERPTRLDPSVCFEELPIELGDVAGHATRLLLVTAPSGPEQAPTRKQLLDEVAGIVLVLDAQRSRLDENLASLRELRAALGSYGRSLDELPVVVQYNKRDASDPFAIEELHRQLELPGAATFEATASEGTGVLKTLTTVSKGVVRDLRERVNLSPVMPATLSPAETAPVEPARALAEPEAAPAQQASAPEAPVAVPVLDLPGDDVTQQAILLPDAEPLEIDDAGSVHPGATGANAWIEDAILEEAALRSSAEPHPEEAAPLDGGAKQTGNLRLGPDVEIVSVGEAQRVAARALRIPVVLGNADGDTATIALRIELEALGDDPA